MWWEWERRYHGSRLRTKWNNSYIVTMDPIAIARDRLGYCIYEIQGDTIAIAMTENGRLLLLALDLLANLVGLRPLALDPRTMYGRDNLRPQGPTDRPAVQHTIYGQELQMQTPIAAPKRIAPGIFQRWR